MASGSDRRAWDAAGLRPRGTVARGLRVRLVAVAGCVATIAACVVTVTAAVVVAPPAAADQLSDYRSVVAADGASAAWRLDDSLGSSSAVDSVGSNDEWTIGVDPGGSFTFQAAGAIVGSTTNHGAAMTTAALEGAGGATFIHSAFTAEAWFKIPVGFSSYDPIFMDRINCVGVHDHLIYINNGTVHGQVVTAASPGSPVVVDGTRAVADGEWHHVALALGSGSARLYVDGVLDSEQVAGSGILSCFGGSSDAWWGSNLGGIGGSATFTGSLDELAFYGTALDDDQVATHYKASGRVLVVPVDPHEAAGGDNCASRTVGAAHDSRGKPVDTGTGNFWHTFTDLSLPGRSPLTFGRTYNSIDNTADIGLGYGWSGIAVDRLTLDGSGNPTVHQDNGAVVAFAKGGASPSFTYTPLPRYDASLTYNSGTSEWTFACTGNRTLVFEATTDPNVFRLKSQTDRNGYTTSYGYTVFGSTDGVAHVSSITDPTSRALTVTWSGNPTHVSQVSDPAGRTVNFTYSSNNLVEVEDVGGGFSQFAYDGSNRLVTWSTPNFGSGSLPSPWTDTTCVTTTPPAGVLSNVYVGDQVVCQSDAEQNVTEFAFDYGGTLGATWVKDANGNETVDYYTSGVRTKTTRGYGTGNPNLSWTYDYDPATAAITKVTDPDGNEWVSTYDAKGNRLSSDDPVHPPTTVSGYDSFGNPADVTDGNGATTTYSYNGSGNLTGTSRPLLDKDGNPVLQGGTPKVVTTSYTYDTTSGQTGDVLSMVDVAGKTWSSTYDTYGMPISVTTPDPDGVGTGVAASTTLTCYDSVGRRTGAIAPLAAAASVTCGSMPTVSGKSCSTPPTGIPDDAVAYVVDDFGRDVVSVNSAGAKTCWTYDDDGNLLTTQDANGNTTTFDYDDADRQTVQHRPTSPATTVETDYDGIGNVTVQRDGATAETSYVYDNPAFPTAPTSVTTPATATNPSGETTGYGYDNVGNQTTVEYPGGNCATPAKCTTYGYDDAGQLTSIDYSDPGTPDVTNITYDDNGQRIAMSDGSGASPQSWGWDSLGRLTEHVDAAGQTVGYGYASGGTQDPRNLVRTITYPGGSNTVTRTFDDMGRMTSTATWLSTSTTTFGYDADSNLTSITYPNGVVSTITPDAQTDATTGITHVKSGSTLASLCYSHTACGAATDRDAMGQVTSMSQTGLPGSSADTYTYTALNQLKQVNGQNKYSYDNADNLTKLNGNQQLFDNDANQLTSKGGSSAPTATSSYFYDARGQRTASVSSSTTMGSRTYGWDEAGRMTSFDLSRFLHLSGGNSGFSAAITTDGDAWSTGSDSKGQLGDGGSSTDVDDPVAVTGSVPDFKDISTGFTHTLAMGTDNSVWAWGGGTLGSLGQNANSDSQSPVQVKTGASTFLTDAAEVAAGDRFSLVRKTDGTVWAFGSNATKQLGQLTSTANTKVAVQVAVSAGVFLTNVGSITAGARHAVALKTDGTVWTWGDNSNGQLGRTVTADNFNNATGAAGADGTTDTYDPVPAQVTGLSDIAQVSSKNEHTLAIDARGAVYAWGSNGSGQLGDNSTTDRTAPVSVTGLTAGVVQVAAGTNHSLALLGDGTLKAWGNNAEGQIGDNTTTRRLTPVAVVYGTPVPTGQIVAIAAGASTSALITAPKPTTTGSEEGEVWMWGRNDEGEQGTNNTTDHSVPTHSDLLAGHLATYAYDGDGLRTTKTSAGPAKTYTYDTAEGLPTVLTYGDISYITGPGGMIIGQISGGGTRTWFQHDQLGSVVLLTDNGGTVTGTASYLPYGTSTTTGATATGAAPNIGYAGQWTDTESNLVWLRARMYDPATGQLLTRDPAAARTRDAYGYVSGNPLSRTDPTGLIATAAETYGEGGYTGEQVKTLHTQNCWYTNDGWQYVDVQANARAAKANSPRVNYINVDSDPLSYYASGPHGGYVDPHAKDDDGGVFGFLGRCVEGGKQLGVALLGVTAFTGGFIDLEHGYTVATKGVTELAEETAATAGRTVGTYFAVAGIVAFGIASCYVGNHG